MIDGVICSISATIVCTLLALTPANAIAQEASGSFDFAISKDSRWEMTATSHINWPENKLLPTIANIDCRGESEQFSFELDRSGTLSLMIRFLGLPDKDGERGEITLLGDRLWLYVDGERWEFAHIPKGSNAFTNIQYPPQPEGDIILIWIGSRMVRKTERDPWQNLSRIQERLVVARKIEWSYKSRNWKDVDSSIPENRLPAGWNTRRYPIDNKGLGEAISWCSKQISSPAAFVLPAGLKPNTGK